MTPLIALNRAHVVEPPSDIRPSDLRLPARFTEYRTGQDRLALAVAAGDRRADLISAPTGSGKSLINVTVARLLGGRTLFLVGTRGLQDQLMAEFEEAGARQIKGRANYTCIQYQTCDDPDRYDAACEFSETGDCPYRRAVNNANRADIVVTNYAYWTRLGRHGRANTLGDFDLLVADEAHTIEGWLTDLCSVTVLKADARGVLSDVGIPRADMSSARLRDWASGARTILSERLKAGVESHEKRARYKEMVRGLKDVVESTDDTAWAVDEQRDRVVVSPVRAAEFSERYLFRDIPRLLLTSATLTPDTARYLGIPDTDFHYHEITRGFDPRRRPFIYVPTVRVDHRMGEGETRIWMNRVDNWIAPRLDRKGVIHARSYVRAREIATRSKFREAMFVHTPQNAREVIEAFKRAKPPAILVSPAVEEGWDFPAEQCRWQIVAKIPFIDGRNALIKARKDDDPGYTNYLAAQTLIQMVGRGSRSADDWCESFIADDHWLWFRNRAKFPGWFRAAWRQEKDVPPPMSGDTVSA